MKYIFNISCIYTKWQNTMVVQSCRNIKKYTKVYSVGSKRWIKASYLILPIVGNKKALWKHYLQVEQVLVSYIKWNAWSRLSIAISLSRKHLHCMPIRVVMRDESRAFLSIKSHSLRPLGINICAEIGVDLLYYTSHWKTRSFIRKNEVVLLNLSTSNNHNYFKK